MPIFMIRDDREIAGYAQRALEEESNSVVVTSVGYPQGCWFQHCLIKNP
jgi:hypothetical protein